MSKSRALLLILAILSLASFTHLNKKEDPKDYLSVPGPINFSNTSYYLSWSTHPNATYYKQEYLPKGEKAEHFNKMILIDVLQNTTALKNIVYGKMAELQKRKEQMDPVVNYKVIQNPDSSEYILDFVLSQGGANPEVVEWNAYRYKSFTDKSGKKGIMLFGVSHRAYGSSIKSFFGSLKETRQKVVNELAKYKIPEVHLPGS